MSDQSANKRIAKNTIFLYLRMFLVMGISLYTSRVILHVLGVEDYGVYNVVAGFVSLFGFLNSTLSTSIQRFYNFELGKNGSEGLNRVYSAGFLIHLILAVFLFIILESLGLWYVNNIMVVPSSRLLAANFVFQAVIVSIILVTLQIPYVGIVLAYERMDFYAIMSIVEVVLQLLIVLVLPLLPYDKLIVYALLLSAIAIIKYICYNLYSKKIIRLKIEKITDKSLLQEILSFSGWNLVGTFAYMAKGQGANMILNLFFGPLVNAARGVAFQVHAAASSFSGNIVTAFRPQIVDSFAKNNKSRVLNLFYSESRLCFALILLLVAPLIIESHFILHLWLGDSVPKMTDIFTKLVLIDLLLGIFNQPVVQVSFATGRIKHFQIANSIVNILLLPTCYILLKIGLESTAVFYATILFTAINQTVCVLELNKQYDINVKYYLSKVILPCIVSATITFAILFPISSNIDSEWMSLISVCCCDIIIVPITVYFFLIGDEEKKYIKSFLRKFRKP